MIPPTTLNQDAALALGSAAGSDARNRFWRLFETAFIGDTLLILLCLGFSSWLRFETPLETYGLSPDAVNIKWTDYALHVGFGTVLLSMLLVNFRLYSLPKSLSLRQVLAIVVKATGIWALAYIGLASLFRIEQDVSRMYVLLSAVVLMG